MLSAVFKLKLMILTRNCTIGAGQPNMLFERHFKGLFIDLFYNYTY